jgi:NADH-quinone oxidoreductase subunit J
MIGAIVLTLRHRPEIKRQNIAKQTVPPPRLMPIELKDPKPGQGILASWM